MLSSSSSNHRAVLFPLAVLLVVAAARPIAGCTTVLIGKDFTADRSVLHAHNEDMGNEAAGRLWWTPGELHPEGATVLVPYVELPQPGQTLGYWASGNAEGAVGLGTSAESRSYDSVLVGLNERGVSMSCNWAHSREKNREGVGIRRYAIRQILLEQATSAQHGVELLGGLIDTYGQADWGGLIYHLADPMEAWVVETTTHHWVARRVRDNETHVTANRFRIGSDYDLASKTLVRDAVDNGWLASPAARLDFAAVYGLPERMDEPYDTRREDRVDHLLEGRNGSLTPEDLILVLGDRYEGTPFYTRPQKDPVWREDLATKPDLSRTISTNLGQSTFVAHLRDDLPVSIGAMMWIGLGTPSYAAYVPLYAGGGSLPAEYWRASEGSQTDSPFDNRGESAWTLFRRLQQAGDESYRRSFPAIQALGNSRRAIALEEQRRTEAEALDWMIQGDDERASRTLAGFSYRQAADALHHARRLLELYEPTVSDNIEVRNRGEGKDQWWDALPRKAWSAFQRVDQSQDWFEVYEIQPRVFAIYEPGQFEEVISYLIVGSQRALLFDTGLGIGDMRRLVGELTDKETVVLNSHTHYDHVGGNHAFETIYGTDLEYTRSHERGRSHDQVAEFVGDGWIWKPTPEGFSVGDYVSRPFGITHRVEDGQILSLGDVELEVLLTPGHAPDSLCLLDRKRRLLFTGDTFYPATLYAHLPGSMFEDYKKTAARLAGLATEIDLALPAHNEPTMTASELVVFRNAFEEMQQEEAEFVSTDGNREYFFGRFSILVSEPPPWAEE